MIDLIKLLVICSDDVGDGRSQNNRYRSNTNDDENASAQNHFLSIGVGVKFFRRVSSALLLLGNGSLLMKVFSFFNISIAH